MTLQQPAREDGERSSHVVRAAAPRMTLSERLWGLDWSDVLPHRVDDATFERGTFDDAVPFMTEHYPRIFGVEPDRFLVEEMTEAKRRFGDEMDVFVIRADERTAGIMTGHPTDWSTYYVRTFSLLPEYRERRWMTQFNEVVSETLRRFGCGRWEADCSPANTAMVRFFTSNGFLQTGTLTSERWGQMLRYTKFLRGDAAEAFRRQFIYVPAFGRNAKPK